MIWTTAKSTEVNRRSTVRPMRSNTSGFGGRADSAHAVTGLAIAGSSGVRRGSARQTAPAARRLPRSARRHRRPCRPPRSRRAARPRSRRRGRRGPRARPSTRSRPGVIPAAARASSSSWRWVVEGGWLTIVKTLPSEAVRSVIVRVSMNASPAARPPASSNASIPPPRASCSRGDVVLGVAGQRRVPDPAHAGPALEPGRERARGRSSDAPSAGRASRGRASRGTRRAGRGWRPCRPGSRGRGRRATRTRRRCPPSRREWPDRYFVADSQTRSAPSSIGRQRYGEANVLSTT